MTEIWQRAGRVTCLLVITAASFILPAHYNAAAAQSIVVMVNDEPVTSYDIAQRQRFLALSTNLGGRMKQRMESAETKQAFQRYMQEHKPGSREEAKALQRKFVQRLQQSVIANAGQSMRKKATDELIEEKLMLQAARELKITVTEDEVDGFLTRMAQSGKNKRTLEQFLASFKAQGVNPSTLKDRIRAQIAWRQVIRYVYGSRIRTSTSNNIPTRNAGGGTIVDTEIVRLKAEGDQLAVAAKLLEAETIRKNFKSCEALSSQISAIRGATVQSVKQANLSDFRGDAQAVLQKANAGQMAPPIVKGSTIELYVLCAKKVVEPKQGGTQTAGTTNETQQQFILYSKRHLKDLKARALLKYPKNG